MTAADKDLVVERLGPEAQAHLVAAVLLAAEAAPFRTPATPYGTMSVLQTNLGARGWVSSRAGYGYAGEDPLSARPWPQMPELLADLWSRHAPGAPPADACLVNLYRGTARMGAHRDLDEADLGHPVLSVSLGDDAVFRLGGLRRSDPACRIRLSSGDVLVLRGPDRLAYHGIDRVLAGTSDRVPGGGRLNLTLRRAGI